ncbi:sigma-54 interaction domain-containing protein [Aminipila luticellarii]|uniref:PAS domain-containing protein n=1 Tax=Aminipila luticellarii TaxID=2507160 RepID=A0A410PTT9_9FIRM|nr:sigma 54-interacting transcriptional regulator [Aminipila luticellarii]QAT42345.1 PAS domain-containing protein [Aminipila luticellarii]
MKIYDIMKPWEGEWIPERGIDLNSDIQTLRAVDLDIYGARADVTDQEGRKVGEVDIDILKYLVDISTSQVLDSILDKFQEGVIAIDARGRIFYLNHAYSKILDIPIRKIIGKNIRQAEPGAEIINVLETGIPITKQKQYIKTLDKYVSPKIYPMKENGQIIGAVSIFKDTTKEVKLKEEVVKANEIAMNFKRQIEAQQELSKLEIVGKSTEYLKTVSQALIVAKTEASVLIKGENGSGKEVIAKMIHMNSGRKDHPMITVNCAAIPENLIESEFFGYEGGAFTGAKAKGQMGKFELANGGTLFLDEIGDMPFSMQAKLLRVLQTGEIEKIGRQKNVPVNVRLIAATNQPLEDMVAEKKFRQDLYFRLNIVEINVPSLRQRREDIGLFANYYLQKYNQQYQKSVALSPEVLSFFYSYSWPGNVRELQNCVEYAVIMCTEDSFGLEYLPPHMLQPAPSKEGEGAYRGESLKKAVSTFEKAVILDAMGKFKGNRNEVMQALGLSRRTFYRKLKEYEINCDKK